MTSLRLFNDPFYDTWDRMLDVSRFTPQSTVKKNDGDYKVIMSVPGLTKDDLKITIKEGLLTISYKKEEKTDSSYFTGNFSKSYSIPDEVNESEINGKVENGILEITLPFSKKKALEKIISLS